MCVCVCVCDESVLEVYGIFFALCSMHRIFKSVEKLLNMKAKRAEVICSTNNLYAVFVNCLLSRFLRVVKFL